MYDAPTMSRIAPVQRCAHSIGVVVLLCMFAELQRLVAERMIYHDKMRSRKGMRKEGLQLMQALSVSQGIKKKKKKKKE
jgi:hypothetical protein